MLQLFEQFDLTHPARLLALMLVPLIVYFAWRTTTMMLAWQRICSTLLRVAIFVLLVLATTQPVFHAQTEQQFVVIVADRSGSAAASFEEPCHSLLTAATAQKGGEGRLRLVAFAGNAIEVDTAESLTSPDDDRLGPMQSNPADALRFAAGLVPEGYVPTIVLLTDGIETRGDLFTAAQGIRMPVHVVPLTPFLNPEVSVDRVIAPPEARPQSPFGVEVIVR
jgi:hypothetical protein